LDRLSSLISQFEIRAERLPPGAQGTLGVVAEAQSMTRLYLRLRPDAAPLCGPAQWLNLRLDVGGPDHPLLQALPPCVEIDLADAPNIAALAGLIRQEAEAPRCGGDFALGRLCEVLVVTVLRQQIEAQSTEIGVFAGLAHPKLARVLVAMHDAPGRAWRMEDLLPLAALSRTQFIAEFQRVVGITPMAYLKRWRMELARQAVLNGERVGRIAFRLGYKSSEAFTRAFTDAFGAPPSKLANALADG